MGVYIRNFFMIVAGGMVAAVLGGLFGAFIAWLSPEFVGSLFCERSATHLVRYAAAVGAIWGLFIGAAAMGFGMLVAAIASWRSGRSGTTQ